LSKAGADAKNQAERLTSRRDRKTKTIGGYYYLASAVKFSNGHRASAAGAPGKEEKK